MHKGLYERIIDRELAMALKALSDTARSEALDPADSHALLAEHLRQLISGVLRRQPSTERLRHQTELVNRIVAVLEEFDPGIGAGIKTLPADVEQLLVVFDGERAPDRPDTPVSASSLLTGTRADPSLLSQLKLELATADRVDFLCSFIKWSGIGLLRDALEAFCNRAGTRLRVLTTSYMGATDLAAVEALATLPNTEVRVSYDTHRTRLHAKAYLFERLSGFSTAYVGSANLSRPALTEGLEWTLKATQYADAAIWDKVRGTFESYWGDPEFEPFEAVKLRDALAAQRAPLGQQPIVPAFELRPFQFQQEILDALAADRTDGSGPHRQLVVAATGTGKTMIAAFDYRRVVREHGGRYPRLLFVAHRRELLLQSMHSFRAVLRDQNFGDLLDATSRPVQLDYLFATIQTLHGSEWAGRFAQDHFDYIVIDETHRSAASSYQGLLDRLRPSVLLGLTATPERADGEDILRYFDDRVVCEIRLPDAINRRLVVPFHYYGLSDSADFRRIRWQGGGYRPDDLNKLVTGDEVRARLILDQCRRRLQSVRDVRGLAFCVSVEHARFMCDFFVKSGIPSGYLTGQTARAEREQMQQRLRRREINFIFVVDLYNEGVDIPDVDTVLFLRPTESLTVFLQQLGRGLRLTEDKDYLTVLDFVGQMHEKFRFDRRLRALMMEPQKDLKREIHQRFPSLPAGCAITLERKAEQRILENIRRSALAGQPALVRDIADFEADTGKPLSFGVFLQHYGLQPDDVLRRASWSRLLVRAGCREPFHEPDEKLLTGWLRRIAHADDAVRLERWSDWLQNGHGSDSLVLALLLPILGPPADGNTAIAAWRRLQGNPTLLQEARDLVSWMRNQPGAGRSRSGGEGADTPLVLHAHYTRDEILTLTGVWTWSERAAMREGVKHLPDKRLDLFLTTLEKSEKHYSPTTMYVDYAIDARRFHWQSQSTTSEASPTGQRYIHHAAKGYRPLLFVRDVPRRHAYTQPYAYLGELEYQSHEGSRPISFVWRVKHEIPARILRVSKRLVAA
ncbi:superfamily II DNA or RNA helicase/HKD family nuclease [Natronocella acetinitrilica]|uniref:Superfamily II DNA or RNA helicase/HKD family nuclease n=1 Tax=Natronocella acetinitrilica TaxID=414046 RepID=A0AAE3G4Q7_9GAMM|nr:DEAD/DEAH box helicase [Natronocella acetinitrilica]MCP1673812.1 superfamily II DNA or RNA helicase/HKD family nuclease [Natronocella acetinitrilica]